VVTVETEIARLDELTEGVGCLKRAGRKPVVLFKVNGEVYATDPNCPHWGGPIAEGKVSVKRLEVECPWHRFRFDLKTGACVAANLRPAIAVYPVRVEADRIYVTVQD
jgi:naphthalene 1,2-dioxygenase system ferredoxin subunit